MRFKMNFDRSSALVLLVEFFIVVSMTMDATGKKGDQFGYQTTYACEGNTLNIACSEGVIYLIRANYGRFSISICNDHGNLDWRVNCMSLRSFLIMKERCSLKPNCSINVSSTTFYDPCPGTRKYLEVQYHCGSETLMLTPPMSASTPSIIKLAPGANASVSHPEDRTPMFTPPSSTTNTTHSTRMPPIPTTKRLSTVFKPFSMPPALSTTHLPPLLVTTTRETTINSLSADPDIIFSVMTTALPMTMVYPEELYCPSIVARGINWTWTKAGETASMKCPEGASGYADWYCSLETVQWIPSEPNLHNCRSLWLESIKRRMKHDSIISITTELALMSSSKPLFSADLKEIGELYQQALYKGVHGMEHFLDMWHRYHVLRELLQSLIQTLNNLLDDRQKAAWKDLKAFERKTLASSLLESLEESALLLAKISSQDGSFSLVKNNVLFSLKVFGLKESSINFPILEDFDSEVDGVYWAAMQDQIHLPAQTLQEYAHHGLVKIVFTAYRNLEEYLKLESNILHHPHDQVSENVTRVVNSRIISASLQKTENSRLRRPVIVTLKHIYEENATNPVCVFWDIDSRDWSARGCWVEQLNRTHTTCACDHLTNFAVIMELKSSESSSSELGILHIVISIGCIIAIICLIIIVIILSSVRVNGASNVVIQKNMFFCLLVSETVFVAGINQTSHPVSCAIVAGALHYFFLASFLWMFFECYQQYVTLITSGDPEKSQARYYYIVAYTLPAVIVGISAVIDPSSYGTEKYCWLHADNYFVFSFVGPAVGIIFGGIVFLCITLCIFWHHTSISTAIKGKEEAKLVNIKFFVVRTTSLIFTVSLTWTSGLLYINKGSVILAYVFSALNCALGVFVLSMYCLGNEKVKQEYKEMFRNHCIFSWCMELKDKEQESQNPVLPGPNRAPSGDHISPQYWNKDMGKSSLSKISTAQGRLSTIAVRNLDCENVSNEANSDIRCNIKTWENVTGSHWKPPNNSSSSESISQEKEEFANATIRCKGYSHPHYRHFLGAPDSSNQFADHIYETIDDDESVSLNFKVKTVISQQFPPAENYYGDHSDLSQHSSSSYGYDQRPLLIGGVGMQHADSPQVCSASGEYSGSQEVDIKELRNGQNFDCEDHLFYPRNKLSSTTGALLKIPYDMESGNSMHGSSPNYNTDGVSPSLPDLLQCPTDNPVVLAVLEGDKVVSHLQPDDFQYQQQPPKYKLSTYC